MEFSVTVSLCGSSFVLGLGGEHSVWLWRQKQARGEASFNYNVPIWRITYCSLMFLNVLKQGEWSNHIYTKGCIAALEDWLPGNLYTVAIVFIVISLLQVKLGHGRCTVTVSPVSPLYLFGQMVGIYLARTLISDIEKVKFSYWTPTCWRVGLATVLLVPFSYCSSVTVMPV